MKTIQTLGSEFVQKHDWLLTMAWANNVAICGGCAAAISKGREGYVPKDLDLVSTKSGALDFIRRVTDFLMEKSVHFRIYANSNNDFVPFPAVSHFRIQCPFWVPVCLFVLPEEKFRFYRIAERHLLQLPHDVQEAARDMTERDQKPRLAAEPVEEFEFDGSDSDKTSEEDEWYKEFSERERGCLKKENEIDPDFFTENGIHSEQIEQYQKRPS